MSCLRIIFTIALFTVCCCTIIREFPKNHQSKEDWQGLLPQQMFKLRSHTFFETTEDYDNNQDDVPDSDEQSVNSLDGANFGLLSDEFEIINGVDCQKCSPGYGLVSICSQNAPTVCEPCMERVNFSDSVPHFKPCLPCSRCGADMYTEMPCLTEKDTFCSSCVSAKQTMDELIAAHPAMKPIEDWGIFYECDSAGLIDSGEVFRTVKNEEDEIEKSFSTEIMLDDDSSQISIDIIDTPVIDENIVKQMTSSASKQLTTPTMTTNGEQPLVAIDWMPIGYSPNKEDSAHKPVAVLSADKLSSSLIGGFEVHLLPEHLGMSEREFRRPSVFARKFAKKPSTVKAKTTTESIVTPENIFDVGDFDEATFIANFLMDLENKQPNGKDSESQAVIFKPSNHEYPYLRLLHPSQFQKFLSRERRKMALAAAVVVAIFLAFGIFVVVKCRAKRSKKFNNHIFWSSGLTELENNVIQECAQKMKRNKIVSKKIYCHNPFENVDAADDQEARIVENPLDEFLKHEQERDHVINASTEHLLGVEQVVAKKTKFSGTMVNV